MERATKPVVRSRFFGQPSPSTFSTPGHPVQSGNTNTHKAIAQNRLRNRGNINSSLRRVVHYFGALTIAASVLVNAPVAAAVSQPRVQLTPCQLATRLVCRAASEELKHGYRFSSAIRSSGSRAGQRILESTDLSHGLVLFEPRERGRAWAIDRCTGRCSGGRDWTQEVRLGHRLAIRYRSRWYGTDVAGTTNSYDPRNLVRRRGAFRVVSSKLQGVRTWTVRRVTRSGGTQILGTMWIRRSDYAPLQWLIVETVHEGGRTAPVDYDRELLTFRSVGAVHSRVKLPAPCAG
ncbi:MAG TPA: hypothetical protein VG815_08205 [Chloroflexota bacterium]|nr:hypothetical protein [Chloroflexota bacterium]